MIVLIAMRPVAGAMMMRPMLTHGRTLLHSK